MAVASLLPGGIAEESGLVQAGDIITRVNDINITKLPYSSALAILEAIPIGVPVVLLLSTPPGCETFLQTTFSETGLPYTRRVVKDKSADGVEHVGQKMTNGVNTSMGNGQKVEGDSSAKVKQDPREVPKENGNMGGDKVATTIRSTTNGNEFPPRCPISPSKNYKKLRYLLDESRSYSDTLHMKAMEVGSRCRELLL